MPQAILVSARDIGFSYDKKTPVLKGADVSIAAGEIVTMLGKSGCGKTTLLKILQGLIRSQSGTVERSAGEEPLASYIPQSLGLVLGVSALNNVLTGSLRRVSTLRSLAGAFPREIIQEARELLLQMGLAGKADSITRSLSGGERQRVAIARALMARPRLILADEFVSQLDALTAEDILGKIRVLASKGTAFLITTHDVELANTYGDRLLVMRQGRIVFAAKTGGLEPAAVLEHFQ